ncbi:hypothetical protein J6590_040309 [Homalodisca vitripennis]|nr:hypothetical protein J6590_040309 [Homalodisca vitripennis]
MATLVSPDIPVRYVDLFWKADHTKLHWRDLYGAGQPALKNETNCPLVEQLARADDITSGSRERLGTAFGPTIGQQNKRSRCHILGHTHILQQRKSGSSVRIGRCSDSANGLTTVTRHKSLPDSNKATWL